MTCLPHPPIVQLLKNFPAFYGIWRFITVFTKALHWSLSWIRSIQSTPPTPWSSKWSLSSWNLWIQVY
jgi:hypothetical protein